MKKSGQSVFYSEGNWYKRNLHTHTTRSDGKSSVEEILTGYKKSGYDFISITDHLIYEDYQHLNESNFITIPGTEIHFRHPKSAVHINFILGTDEMIKEGKGEKIAKSERYPLLETQGDLRVIQKVIDDMCSRGFIAIINHPAWSYMEPQEIADLHGFTAIEAYNSGCGVYANTGYANIFWDNLLRRGINMWGVAADDTHTFHPLGDYCSEAYRGWIMVKAASLTRNDIMKAILDGSFYATQGPEIHEFEIKDGHVVFRCSPVEKIYFAKGKGPALGKLSSQNVDTLTEFEYKLKGDELYVRGECIDSKGRRAYTNPIFLK
ncbi:MAG TPA: CehA/McbA family metallohydrolase [Clostridiaceae bacterium]|nr:CehA/McbA family metallohydrolase [Clostridiaceae bacterium]